MFMANKGLDKQRRLHIAAREGDIERISDLLKSGDNVDETNEDGDTPLHLAVWKQSKPAIKLLVLNGASTIKHDARGKSPLEKAKQWGGEELEAFLNKVLEDHHVLQSDLRTYMLTGDWNEFDKTLEYRGIIDICLLEGRTLLQVAAQLDLSGSIRKLLDRDANIQAQDKNGQTALHVAAQSDSFNAIHQLLKSGADIQAQDKNGQTALHVAAQSDLFKAIRQLLSSGADIQAQDKNGQTALHIAAQSDSFEAIRQLLNSGADIQAQDKNGQTALHIAAQLGLFKGIQQLLIYGANIQAQDKNSQTALHVAAQSDSFEAIRQLLSSGADIQAQDKNGQTALHVAAQSDLFKAIRQLLSSGADIQAQDKNGQTALHIAAQSDSFEAIRQLLSSGADIQAQDKNGQIALHLAAQSDSFKAIQQLLIYGANIQAQDKNSQTALHVAAQSDSFEAIQELLSSGADIQAQDKNGQTALHIAAQSDSFEAIRQLLSSGADIQAQDKNGQTALHVAVQSGSLNAIQQLLDHSADIQAQDKDGQTALHIAAQSGLFKAIQKLLNYDTRTQTETREDGTVLYKVETGNNENGQINSVDNDGKTPLHLAAQAGHESVVRLLVRIGRVGSANLADNTGKTPLHLAAEAGYKPIIQLLLEGRASELVSVADNDGKSPSHLATKAGHESAIELLATQDSKLPLSLDDIVKKKPPVSSSNDRTLLTDVTVSDMRSTRWDYSMISSLRNSSADAFRSICSIFLSSELPPHVFRIRWTCHCGHRSHDDYISERRVVKSVADRINSSGIKAEILTWRESGVRTLLLALKNMALSGHRKYAGSHRESGQGTSPNLRADMNLGIAAPSLNQGVQGDTQDISEMELESAGGRPIKAVKGEVKDEVRFLHLCIHGESQLPCVGHVMIDPKSVHAKIINGDQQLFKEIKERYLKACEKRMTAFIKLKGIYFVQVSCHCMTLSLYANGHSFGSSQEPW
jgi:cytohesin